jgi:small subunit ribosomal protein S16
MGKKKQPIYKVVAADARSPRDGKFLEALGIYNPLTNPHTVDLKEDRINYWLDNGAQPTDTVKSLFRKSGINLKRDLAKRKFSEEKTETVLKEWQNKKEAASQKKTVKKSKKAAAKEAKTEEQPAVEQKAAEQPAAE